MTIKNYPTLSSMHVIATLLLLVGFASPAWADDDHTDNHTLVDDMRLYVTAPIHWDKRDWLYAGGVVAAIAASHQYDNQVREHFITNSPDLTDKHSTKDALPAVAVFAGTFALSWVWDDDAGYREARNMVEAGAFSVATVYVTKQFVHRDRPNVTADSSNWKHGDSFPSLHVAFAGAIGGVLAESGSDNYHWVRRVLGYGLIAGSAYLRLQHNQHWLSDTVTGAALGISTAHFVVNRNRPYDSDSSLTILPIDNGVALNYSVSFH